MKKWINKKIKEIQNRKRGFPQYRFGIPLGWEARGEMGHGIFESDTVMSHKFCNTIVHIGKEDEALFRYCPKCLIKTVETEKITND